MSIKVNNVSYIYSPQTPFEKVALKDISFEITKGDFLGIIGHTGSGKSTLIQMFNGLLSPTSGTIEVGGVNVNDEGTNKNLIRQKVGLVFQYPEYQLFEISVYKDVAYGPTNQGLSQEEIKERVERCLHAVGLTEEMWEKSPFELSGGQKRRVAIAGVLAMNPEILVLDEPTAGLDPKGRDELFEQLKYLNKELGLTIVLISHSMEDVARYVSNLIVLHEGSLVFKDTPREIFKHVKQLESIGLAPPQIKYIVESLNEKGIHISKDILTVEEAAKKIIEYFKEDSHD